MTPGHFIAREYTEPIGGLAPISEILIVECTCGEEMSTYCIDRAASAKALAAEHASHAASMHETETKWTITESLHPDCTGCAALKESAVIHARAIGSIGATYTANDHSCTVTRNPEPEPKPAVDYGKPETLEWANDFTRAIAYVIEGHEDDDTAEVIEWLHAHECDSFLWDMINRFTGRIQEMAREDGAESR